MELYLYLTIFFTVNSIENPEYANILSKDNN